MTQTASPSGTGKWLKLAGALAVVAALVAACLAVEADPWCAAVAATLMMGIAGELAAARSEGPGSFATALLDALYRLDEAAIVTQARVT